MTKRLARLACFLLLGLALSYAEHLLLDLGIPGVKWGLPNLVVLLLLIEYGWRDALLVNTARILLAGLLFGNLFGTLYGLTGSLFAIALMTLLLRLPRVGPVGASVAGGVAHNIGQLLAAMVLLANGYIVAYLPLMLLAGTIAGLLNGLLAYYLLRALHKAGW